MKTDMSGGLQRFLDSLSSIPSSWAILIPA